MDIDLAPVQSDGGCRLRSAAPAPGAKADPGAAPHAIPPARALEALVHADRDDHLARRRARRPHSESFPHLLQMLNIALVVSTCQGGRLLLVRGHGPRCMAWHRRFARPMGIAVGGGGITLGTIAEVRMFGTAAPNQSADMASRGEQQNAPCRIWATGDIRVHELAYVGPELWLVNTRFSCLCSLGPDGRLVPRWKPPFVSRLAPEDRCHLNGLAVSGDQVRYVTALGRTDTPDGWRSRKASGGVLLEVPSGRIVASGLAMPHSPRFHAGSLWVLDSGHGTVCTVDAESGGVEAVCRLPGFTRGLAFHGGYAFVGLSRTRARRTFGGLPLEDGPGELQCAIYAIDIRTGRVAGFVRLDADAQELFDIQVLPESGVG